jgi:hypothetical protein
MKRSTRCCVVASPQSGIIAVGSYDGQFYSIPADA